MNSVVARLGIPVRTDSYRAKNTLQELLRYENNTSETNLQILQQIQSLIADASFPLLGRHHGLQLLQFIIKTNTELQEMITNATIEWIFNNLRELWVSNFCASLQEQLLCVLLNIFKLEDLNLSTKLWCCFFQWLCKDVTIILPSQLNTIRTIEQRTNIKVLRLQIYSITHSQTHCNFVEDLLLQFVTNAVMTLKQFLPYYRINLSSNTLCSLVCENGINYAPSQFMYLNILLILSSSEVLLTPEHYSSLPGLIQIFSEYLPDLESFEVFHYWNTLLASLQDDELVKVLLHGIRLSNLIGTLNIPRKLSLLKFLSPHLWFYIFLKHVGFDHNLIVDLLVSGETLILEYLLE
jgi:hypothetical protein